MSIFNRMDRKTTEAAQALTEVSSGDTFHVSYDAEGLMHISSFGTATYVVEPEPKPEPWEGVEECLGFDDSPEWGEEAAW